jgi:hypothetical protein
MLNEQICKALDFEGILIRNRIADAYSELNRN